MIHPIENNAVAYSSKIPPVEVFYEIVCIFLGTHWEFLQTQSLHVG